MAPVQLLDRRIQNVREEIARFDEKTERKRSAGKQRKKSLEEQHVQLVERKRQLEMQAAQKNKDAADIEAQVRRLRIREAEKVSVGLICFFGTASLFHVSPDRFVPSMLQRMQNCNVAKRRLRRSKIKLVSNERVSPSAHILPSDKRSLMTRSIAVACTSTEVYSLKVNKALDSINTLNAQPIDLGS